MRESPRTTAEPADARMAQSPGAAGLAEERLGKRPWGRQGEFQLLGQRVHYERGADRLALFEPLPPGLATPLRFSWAGPAGDSAAVCESWMPAAGAAVRSSDARPWVLSCRWGSAPAAMLQIGEGQRRNGVLTREGAYRRGELTLGLRSAHRLEGSTRPQAGAVGYEMLYQGDVVASLDLAGPTPRLRRPDPATPLGRAVTEAALALALVSEPR
ncbi:hypothetical protein [Pelomonas cellulosilytica]|uniref:Uncharacterized protein n=1 Tax=Pelomonas cellulosilytica TaxID=2906762 RepID=A0ABS8XUB4_9BURK|nr:hypothetical protein [Pelomonas sp. P8]MCE4556299.1 hypothetical protein [Pelomonas sp. P8]